jgi:outer membrane lipoprotein carrier protein
LDTPKIRIMRKFIAALTVMMIAQAGIAQYDPQAKSILDAMSAKYKSVSAFQATFNQKIENQAAGLEEEMEGEITVKGKMYKLEVIGTEIYNNGKEVWVYTPDLEEATVSPYNPEEEEITPGNVYDIYKSGFKYALISKLSNGDRVIELDPESREKTYHKIRLIVDSKNNMKSFTVFEKSGNRYIYKIENFKPIASLSDSFFTFDASKNPGVEVVDFR